MTLQHQTSEEPRYDAETLRKVTALAQRLQTERQETLSAHEMEKIGAEVGLEPVFIRKALDRLMAERYRASTLVAATPHLRKSIVSAWWATGWMLPFILSFLGRLLFGFSSSGGTSVLGWGIYIAGGILLSGWLREGKDAPTAAARSSIEPLSRADLLDALFTLQKALEGQKQHRAFLSVDVVGSAAMKAGEPDLAVEYSFNQLQRWIEETVRTHGGELHSAAGDGMMCVFTEDAAALRAARALQYGLSRFNTERNRLSRSFQIRCGVSAGDVALDPGVPLGRLHSAVIDRAAQLQKTAAPGDIVVSSELAAAGLIELGALVPTHTACPEPAFSWREAPGQRSGQ